MNDSRFFLKERTDLVYDKVGVKVKMWNFD